MSKIFISYSRVDKSLMNRLTNLLSEAYEVVWNDQKIVGGDEWQTEIFKRITECAHFLFLVSSESLESEWCQIELKEAQRLNKHIVPILVRDRVKLPSDLKLIQWIDMSSEINIDNLNKLYAALIRNSILSISSELRQNQIQADKKLLGELWGNISSNKIAELDHQTQNRMIDYEFYSDTVLIYLRYRNLNDYPEHQFCLPQLENSFRQFDKIFEDFREQLVRCYTRTRLPEGEVMMADIHYLDNLSTREPTDKVRRHKIEEYEKTVQAVLNVRKQHAELVQSIKTIMPEFNFTA